MTSLTTERIRLAYDDVVTGNHLASPGGSVEPNPLDGRPISSDIKLTCLADERPPPHSNGNGNLPDCDAGQVSTLDPDMAEQAVWVAEQLRSSLEPNVVLERSQEVLDLIYERYCLMCRHKKLFIPPEIRQDFYKVVVDELIGFEPPDPPLNNGQRTMET